MKQKRKNLKKEIKENLIDKLLILNSAQRSLQFSEAMYLFFHDSHLTSNKKNKKKYTVHSMLINQPLITIVRERCRCRIQIFFKSSL
jgi:hypothetical protein